MFKRVIVGMDGSTEALNAAQEAFRLGLLEAPATVELASVLDRGFSLFASAGVEQNRLEELALKQQLEPAREVLEGEGVTVSQMRVLCGKAAPCLAGLANSENFDLLVLGHQALGRVTRLLMGSVSEQLVGATPAAVLVCPWLDGEQSENAAQSRPIVVPTDLSRAAERGLETATELAKAQGRELILLCCVPQSLDVEIDPSTGVGTFLQRYEKACRDYVSEVQSRLEARAADLRAHGLKVQALVRQDDLPHAVLSICAEVDAGLIVMGSHGRTGVARWLLGSQAIGVLRESRWPVLIMKSGFAETGAEDLP
jgi:nucleotide-binding universal stress UspA family protein